MSFNLRPAGDFGSPPEIKTKERKSRSILPMLQMRWPMRASRSIESFPTSAKPEDVISKRKTKSTSLLKSKSIDMLVMDTRVNSQRVNRPEAGGLQQPTHSLVYTSLEWTQKQHSPEFPDAHALECVRLPDEMSTRTPVPDKKTKPLNSMSGRPNSINIPQAKNSSSILAHQRHTSDPSRTHYPAVNQPPNHPGRDRSASKVSNIDTQHGFHGLFTSGTVTPIISSSQRQTTPAFSEDMSFAAGLSIVSTLPIDMPQPQYFFVPPSFENILKNEAALSVVRTRKTDNSSTSSDFDGRTSPPNSPSSSRSSVCSIDIPYKSDAVDTSEVSRGSRAYSLLSPVAAGVFDDEPNLKRNPTFKKKFSNRYSRDKPLPPDPTINIPPLSIRRTSRASMGLSPHAGRLIQPTSKPQFLPLAPRPSDLDILDEAFRRSGLHRGPHNPRNVFTKSISSRASKSSTKSSSPSLRTATLDLEEQLSVLTGSKYDSSLWLKLGRKRSSISGNPIASSSRALKQHSSWRGSPSHSILSPHASSLDTKIHASFTLSLKKSWTGKEKIKVVPFGTAAIEKSHKSQMRPPQPPPSDPQNSANGNSVNIEDDTSNNSKDGAKSFEKMSRPKARTGSVERSLRLRLPRLRTQLGAKPVSGPVNLSIVMESPTDQKHHHTNNQSPRERIMVALDRIDPWLSQPEPSRNRCSNNGDNVVINPSSTLVLHDRYRVSQYAGSKDVLCQEIPSEAAKSIIYQIMQKIDNLEDLFNLSVINKTFYRVFKEHSLTLIKDTLFRMSPAAWELREICPPWEIEGDETGDIDMPVPEYTPNLYIYYYTRDLYTMVALKSLVLVRCENFLRPDTTRALAGLDEVRCVEIDEAFWRVWTFCKLFGCGKSREDDIVAQVDWLNGGRLAAAESCGTTMVVQYPLGVHSVLFNAPPGFSKGNHGGLSSTELYDMMEIWTCLGVLLQVFHGKCKEARDFGIFDGLDVESSDVDKEESLLESWTQYILTLGPSAILALTSINPDASIETLFARAQSNGWTKWTAPDISQGGPPRSFFKEAVSQVYESRIATIQTPISSGTPKSNSPAPYSPNSKLRHGRHTRNVSSSSSSSMSSQHTNPNRRRQAGFAAELRRKRNASQSSDLSIGENAVPSATNFKEERPISNFSAVIERLDGRNDPADRNASQVPIIPTLFPLSVDTVLRSAPGACSSIQNTPIVSDTTLIKGKSQPPVPPSAPPRPNLTLESPTPPPQGDATQLSSSILHVNPHQQPKHPPKSQQVCINYESVQEKISRGRYAVHTSLILDPVDVAMYKMVKELGFSEADAKWALKCTDTGESLDVIAAINLLLQSGGRVDPSAVSSTTVPDSARINSRSAMSGGFGGTSASGPCGRNNMGVGLETYNTGGVWRPVWRWA
ncbi:hypothetical protein PAAG_04581 [Paracoccidioides lutzii Pb01]|uniref:Uncharacterized protein n=1 Tax=Paracoccidioides lutzii (strain ATCC MYA-826 / Pb01) TaxID=502779 RepID=C1H1D7_PARBA|nr:hypothetical protein PAAG_04581 [Paracoccidioides lutzii Pb01]EEH33531.1 hypothetical protein PAAG_04581 [Paracoccidioides lutzii Pb01]